MSLVANLQQRLNSTLWELSVVAVPVIVEVVGGADNSGIWYHKRVFCTWYLNLFKSYPERNIYAHSE